MATNSSIVKILLLAANPKNTSRLRLDEEVREIREGLRLAREREQFQIDSHWAVRTRDFYRQMLDMQPQIVHFSGHGTGKDGIVLEDETGKAELLSTEQLSSLFKLFASKGVKCVLLNACYSKEQADAIANHIPYVIGMNQSIGDKAAIIFAVAFYDALGAGESIEFAFDLGVTQLVGLKEHEIPVLKKNPNLQLQVLDSLNTRSVPMLNSSEISDKVNTLIKSNAEQIGMVVQGGVVSFDNLNM
jgi:CHAT domain